MPQRSKVSGKRNSKKRQRKERSHKSSDNTMYEVRIQPAQNLPERELGSVLPDGVLPHDIKYIRVAPEIKTMTNKKKLCVLRRWTTAASCPFGAGLCALELEDGFRVVQTRDKGWAWMQS